MSAKPVDMFRLSDRVAVITGAGGGIGAAIATVLARAGAHVVVTDINANLAEATAKQIVTEGFSATSAQLDVSVKSEVDGLVDAVVGDRRHLDIFVNNAGITAEGTPLTVTGEELDRIMAVNFKGLVYGSQAAARTMIQRGSGAIVNITTAGIDQPLASVAAYTSSKAAAHQYTRSLALEIAPKGVRVNAVAPGWVETPLTRRHLADENGDVDPAQREQFRKEHAAFSPLGVVGEPIDQAYAVLYLVSDEARFVTGAVLRPNGGMTMLW
jgi:3-oxoacyl-[acyl-carrier protein] reductase